MYKMAPTTPATPATAPLQGESDPTKRRVQESSSGSLQGTAAPAAPPSNEVGRFGQGEYNSNRDALVGIISGVSAATSYYFITLAYQKRESNDDNSMNTGQEAIIVGAATGLAAGLASNFASNLTSALAQPALMSWWFP